MNKKLKIKKKTVSEQNKQLHDLKNFLKAAKYSYQEVTKKPPIYNNYKTPATTIQTTTVTTSILYFSKPNKY